MGLGPFPVAEGMHRLGCNSEAKSSSCSTVAFSELSSGLHVSHPPTFGSFLFANRFAFKMEKTKYLCIPIEEREEDSQSSWGNAAGVEY